jgi:hypothetical protein
METWLRRHGWRWEWALGRLALTEPDSTPRAVIAFLSAAATVGIGYVRSQQDRKMPVSEVCEEEDG